MPELQIIDQELFDQAQEIVTQRKTKNAEWRNIPRQNGNGALLGGNLYCATCGRRMTSSNPGKGAKRDKAEYGSFICVLVTTAARKQGILMARSYNTLFGAFLPDCTLLDLENVPCQQIPLDMPPVREAVR